MSEPHRPRARVVLLPGVGPIECGQCGHSTAHIAEIRGTDGHSAGRTVLCRHCHTATAPAPPPHQSRPTMPKLQ